MQKHDSPGQWVDGIGCRGGEGGVGPILWDMLDLIDPDTAEGLEVDK